MSSRQYDLFQHRLTKETLERLPNSTYCTDSLETGVVVRKRSYAIQKRYVAYNKKVAGVLVLDLDYPSYTAYDDVSAPPPNFIIRNKKNNHTHYAYVMTHPVRLYDCEQTKPMRKYARVAAGLTQVLNADPMYRGFIAKSLWSEYWDTSIVEPWSYSLDELANELPQDALQINKTLKPNLTIDDYVSRNVWLFDVVRKHAYRYVRSCTDAQEFHDGLFEYACRHNLNFPPNCPNQGSMSFLEVKAIVRSITKWVWARFSTEGFSAVQARRGRRGGLNKGKTQRDALLPKVIAMLAEGQSIRQVAKATGVPKSTIAEWSKR